MNKIVNFNREARHRAAKETRKQIDDLKKINKRVNSLTEVDFSEPKVPLITVYYDTVDFPEQIVARVFEMNHPTNIYVNSQSHFQYQYQLQLQLQYQLFLLLFGFQKNHLLYLLFLLFLQNLLLFGVCRQASRPLVYVCIPHHTFIYP